MEEPIGHELFQLPRDLHEGVHLLPAGRVPLLVVVEHVAAGYLARQVAEQGH